MSHDPAPHPAPGGAPADAAGALLALVRRHVGDAGSGVVAQLALLVGDQQVEYATTNLTRSAHGHLEGTLVVYTASSLFVQRVTATADGSALSIAVVSRRALRRLETSEEEYRDAPGESRWPTRGQVFATYETFSRGLQLPLDARSGEEAAAFTAFLPSLVADLAG